MIGLSLMIASYIPGRLYPRNPAQARTARESSPNRRRHGRVSRWDHPRGIISGVFTATEAAPRPRLRADPDDLRLQGDQDFRTPGNHMECCRTNAVVMLLIATCRSMRGFSPKRNAQYAGRQFLQLIQSNGLPAHPQCFLLIGHVRRHDAGADHACAELLPLALKFDINLVHLGLIMVINLSFGLTTPPVGTACVVALKVGNISMEKIIPHCCRCSRACARMIS